MRSSINKLYRISQKEKRLIIGLMSGTSLDGLDIALCSLTGAGTTTAVEVLEFMTIPYDISFREDVKSVFANKHADLEKVCLLNEVIASTHADMILLALDRWNYKSEEIDLIASHGQTIFHAPKILHQLADYPNGTLQIGDGDHIAVKTGIITVSDFRQKHIAAGGEGAPLAVYGDYLVFSKKGENRIMLNIGGIANFTFLPSDGDASKVFSTDVGPGNTLMDHYVQMMYPGKYYDKDAALAKTGKVNLDLLMELLSDDFFGASIPKTTGPELFNLDYLKAAQEMTGTASIDPSDVLATLCHFSAEAISAAISSSFDASSEGFIYLSGGGMHNPMLVDLLKQKLSRFIFQTTASLSINPDAKEAVLFALLANETVAGDFVDFGVREGVPSVSMGKISFPD